MISWVVPFFLWGASFLQGMGTIFHSKWPANEQLLQGSALASSSKWLANIPGQISSRPHTTWPPKGSEKEGKWDPLFQGNLGWWNIIIWPDICWLFNWMIRFHIFMETVEEISIPSLETGSQVQTLPLEGQMILRVTQQKWVRTHLLSMVVSGSPKRW